MTKKYTTIALAALMAAAAVPTMNAADITPERVTGWGDFKLFLDPGHEGRSNVGIWSYSEAEKVLAVGLNIKDMLETYTDMPAENLMMCRYTESDQMGLQERSDVANAWGADFYYSIHSDAGNAPNMIVLLFGGWKKDGEFIEKTPNGGKRYGEFLEPNLSGVMRVGSRGNRYDRDFYYPNETTHANQYPYLSVNRESNMPSLLSEGAYHTQAVQQRRNMNAEYKRLEAFAAFQSLLQYHGGMELPQQTFLHGMVTNSENGQPINGAVVTVDGKTYTTDTFESLFNKYTKNPNLIQNGLYTFENLAPGEYEVKVEADGFEPVTTTVTVKCGGNVTTDYVAFCDVEMKNISPAKVDACSAEDLSAVSPLNPMTLTFSRNMDRESVEKAFSISNNGDVTMSWQNDYTLDIDVSKLRPMWSYVITIDGSVAKNSQTGMQLDGDGDGVAGGDYVLSFTMDVPDEEAPEIVSTYPEMDGEVVYTHRPPVSIEYDEEIVWNDDNEEEVIVVTDKAGNKVAGKTVHAVVREASVLTFIADQDYPADQTFLVTVKAGLKDRTGNETEAQYFRFMTEYRPQLSAETIVPCTGTDSFWNPGGSGSSAGLDKDNSNVTVLNVTPNHQSTTSLGMVYVFDQGTNDGSWFIREHNPTYTNNKYTDFEGTFTVWVYGDGSNNDMGMMLRNSSDNGLKYKAERLTMDYRGWRLFVWDVPNHEYKHFTGDSALGDGRRCTWAFDSFTLSHIDSEAAAEESGEEIPYQEWEGTIGFNSLEYTKWDENAQRTANIEDIALPDGVNDITVDADNNAPVRYYNINGQAVSGKMMPGVYVRVQGNKADKVVVK